ncbi:30S ribosomal protein S6--L-glutamate ligase [Cytophagaceae bacterium ABcell3]|nr:30S ribosomal protein S6--L-glutamate ligase [Cytophagaceae bacterium ABcell3]
MNIAVLSRNPNLYSTKRLVEAAAERGHEVRVLDHLKCYVGIEANNPTVYYKGEQITGVDAIIPRIGASVTFYGAAIVRQFEIMNVFSATNAQALVKSRDKLRSLQELSLAGINVPKTAFASQTKDIDSLINNVGGTPVIIKLLEGTQGIGVVLAESKKAAKSVIEAFYGLKADILIQEFIQESAGQDIRAFVINGQVVGAIKRQGHEGEFRSNLHRGGAGHQIELSPQEQEAALNAASVMGLNIAGVDMLLSERGPLIVEVNSSPGLQGIETVTKLDIAGKIIEFLEENQNK